MNTSQVRGMVKAAIGVLPLLVLYGYLLAIIYQQWWLRQFDLPADFVYLNSNTLLIAALSLAIMLTILTLCYYSLSPLLNKSNIFRRKNDSSNLLHAGIIALALLLYATYGIVSFFRFQGTFSLFSEAFMAAVGGVMIILTSSITIWGMKSRRIKTKWYARLYLYFERRLMTPIVVSIVLFLVSSYLITGQLSIMNWQAYVKDPNHVLVDGKDKYILIGIFGDKAGVTQKSEFGIETSATKFVDIERISIDHRPR